MVEVVYRALEIAGRREVVVGVGEARFLGELERDGGDGLECVPVLGPEPDGECGANGGVRQPVLSARRATPQGRRAHEKGA